jgi:hypothetical protein
MDKSRAFVFDFPVLRIPIASVRLFEMMDAAAQGMVEAQLALNEQTRLSLQSWEEEGIPPSGFIISQCRMQFPIQMRIERQNDRAMPPEVQMRPRFNSAAHVTIAYRYLPGSLQEDETDA